MKKIIIAATLALCFTGSSFAIENAGGKTSSDFALGLMNAEVVTLITATALVAGGMQANSRATGTEDEAPIDPTCNGSDPLVDGVCTGTTSTVTVTGSGTLTSTITVPVTFTYLPTI
jgi:hypothetical protein